MIHETGEKVLTDLEKRFHGLAFPQILRWIAGFQALAWALSQFSPEFLSWIEYSREAILSGQVWRLLSWVLYPTAGNFLFVAIALLFMFFINDSLEGHWGAFRLNVYVFSTVVCLSLLGLIPVFAGAGFLMNGIFYSAAFLAFASLFPNQIINLFLVIPVKAKWLGMANGALLLAMTLTSPAPLLFAIIVLTGLIPFMLVFIPTFIANAQQRSASAVRLHKFQEASRPESDAFHRCDSCGATDATHPERSFRVTARGEELCEECRSTDNTATAE